MKIRGLLSLIVLASVSCCVTVYAMNLTLPYYAYMKQRYNPNATFQLFTYAEKGFEVKGYNSDGCVVSPLQLWQGKQDALAMLQGFSETSEQGILLGILQSDPQACTLLCPNGTLKEDYGLGFGARYNLPLNFSVSLYLPIFQMSFKGGTWKPQTTYGCERTEESLLNDFNKHLQELGAGLNTGSWTRTGVGDLTLLLEWTRDFIQHKEFLRSVRLNCRCGPSFPTSVRADEDHMVAFSFGNDGAMALVFGGFIELSIGKYMRCSADVELTQLFGNTRDRRIKIHQDQTDLLFLKKVCAYRDPGLIQHFNILVGFYDLFGGAFVSGNYEFYKHGQDRLSIVSNNYSSEVANTAVRLEDWTAHYGIFRLGYDFTKSLRPEARVKPAASFYTRIPFNGTRSALNTTVGFELTLDF